MGWWSKKGEVGQALTPQEQNIAEWIAMGYHNDVMAERLGVTENTVRNYQTRIREKTGARTKTEIALYILRKVKGYD